MKYQTTIRGTIISAVALVTALAILPLSRPAFAASHDLLTYHGGDRGLGAFSCGASAYETCPSDPCTCMTSTGYSSGELTGSGFATLAMTVTGNDSSGCQQFNAAMFVIAPKDLEELDFSGMSCDNLRTFSGNYTIAVSQAGNTGSGTVSGRITKRLQYTLTFQ
jgi:hypothetical protein